MKIEGWRCEGCGTVTFDRYREKGWYSFSTPITRYAGRDEGSQVLTDYIPRLGQGEIDFCSIECLLAELDKAKAKRLELMRKLDPEEDD